MNMEYKKLNKVHEYFTLPSLCIIIKPNSYVPRRCKGNIELWEVKETTGWIHWNEMNHTDTVLILHVIFKHCKTIDSKGRINETYWGLNTSSLRTAAVTSVWTTEGTEKSKDLNHGWNSESDKSSLV